MSTFIINEGKRLTYRRVIVEKDVRKTHRSGDQSLETSSSRSIVAVEQNEIISCVEKKKTLVVTYVFLSFVFVPPLNVSSLDICTKG